MCLRQTRLIPESAMHWYTSRSCLEGRSQMTVRHSVNMQSPRQSSDKHIIKHTNNSPSITSTRPDEQWKKRNSQEDKQTSTLWLRSANIHDVEKLKACCEKSKVKSISDQCHCQWRYRQCPTCGYVDRRDK